jgi:hypothetical protein
MIDFFGDLVMWLWTGRRFEGRHIPFASYRISRILGRLVKTLYEKEES